MDKAIPLPQQSEWWVSPTPDGFKSFNYRSNSRTRVIGPFASKATADMKAAELDRQALRRRTIREAIVCVIAICALTGLLLWVLP